MTGVAPKDNSTTNLSAFDLGVYANQFLWNLDQAFVAGSNDHRLAALGLINGLRSCGAGLVEMKPDMPLSEFLKQIERYLPAKPGPSFMEPIFDSLSHGQDEQDIRPEGEWVYSEHEVGKEREELERVIVKGTLQTPQQRKWFRLGWLIDSGRHRPDTGNYLFKPDLRPLGLLPNPVDPQPIQTRDENSELPLQKVSPSDAEQRRPYRTFTPGELPPPPGWWLELFHLCQKLHVPCDRKQPDLSTVSSIVDAVEQMIASARTTITDSRSDALTLTANATSPLSALSDGHQQPPSGSLTVDSVRQHREGTPFAGGGTVASNGNSTEHRVEEVTARLPVATTGTLAATLQTENTTPHAVVMPDENGPTQIEGSSGSKNGDVMPPMSDPPAIELERIGSWEFWPGEIQFKKNDRVELTNLPRKILKHLLSTSNPDGWTNWKNLALAAWPMGAAPSNKAVSAGVYRLNENLKSYAKKLGLRRAVRSNAQGDDLRFRIDPILK